MKITTTTTKMDQDWDNVLKNILLVSQHFIFIYFLFYKDHVKLPKETSLDKRGQQSWRRVA